MTKAEITRFTPDISSTKGEGLTRYVAQFVLDTQYDAIPALVMELGKKSVLDGVGLALAGSVSETGRLTRKYLEGFGVSGGGATVIGTSLKAPERFAAFANGVSMHADDYDDTQLAVGRDRQIAGVLHDALDVFAAHFAGTGS